MVNLAANVAGFEWWDRMRNLDEIIWDLPPSPATVLWMALATVMAFAAVAVLIARYRRRAWPAWGLGFLAAAAAAFVWNEAGMVPRLADLLGVLLLPVTAVALTATGEVMLVVAAACAGVSKSDFVLTTKAKGLRPAAIRSRHVGRVALMPALSRLAAGVPLMIGGLVIFETAFASLGSLSVGLPGLSSVLFGSFGQRNTPRAMGGLVVIGLITLVVRLIIDLVQIALDPRIDAGNV
jgi:ABC-type dipeptide/oligopeptide/nickel transport system permease component